LKVKKAQGVKLGNPAHLTEAARRLGWKRIRENATKNPNNQRAMRLIVRCRNEKLRNSLWFCIGICKAENEKISFEAVNLTC